MSSNQKASDSTPIIHRLDAIIRLMAISLPKEINQTKKIEILSGVGLTPKEIAEILGTTSNTVSVTLSGIRRRVSETSSQRTDSVTDNSQGAPTSGTDQQQESVDS